VVPEYELKWDAIQRNQGEWDWSGADKLFQWAHSHGKLARGHTALWDQSVPNWVKNLNGDKKRMGDAIYAFVYASVRRYGHVSGLLNLVEKKFCFLSSR
jgi:endo-1,4-beta-xylanase